MMSCAPSAASSSATALPNPLLAAATNTTLSANSNSIRLLRSPYYKRRITVALIQSPNTVVEIRSPYNAAKKSAAQIFITRSEEHTSELQSRLHLVCRLLLE